MKTTAVPRKKKKTNFKLTIESAEDVVRRSHRELHPPSGTNPADARSHLARKNKECQGSDLKSWAAKNSFFLRHEAFSQQWRSQGSVSGQECDVYYDEQSGCYHKRNNTIAYEDWIQFFESIRIHNHLFIDTAYSLLGFMKVEDTLHAVLSQQAVNSKQGAIRSQVQDYMAQFGFHHVGNDHYESESLQIQDLHDENVLVGYDGRLYFIDTCIYLKEGKTIPIDLE
jgi:hypothetical protein